MNMNRHCGIIKFILLGVVCISLLPVSVHAQKYTEFIPGEVWANESWGRYWGWDPKETWALITMVVYAFILHARFLPVLRSDYAFSVMSVLGLASVLMTYFGVNYYLSGLHSYGGGDTPPGLTAVFITYACAFALMIYAGYRRARFGK